MSESEINQLNHQMKTRSRRSALSDISNTIVEKLGFSKKVLKKRKFTDEDGPAEESEVVQSSDETKGSAVEELTTVPLDTDENINPQTVTRSARNSPHYNSSSTPIALKQEKSQEELEFDIYGFYQPPKIRRKLQLYTKGADPRLCLDIMDDLYAFYTDMETIFMPKPYFDLQTEITSRMRTILVDWIVEVHYKYHLSPGTLWLTINIMDRYLEKNNVPRGKLQLVGITALFLACKFEEIHSPQVNDCVYLTDNAYKKEEILQMESSMLQTLDYQIMVPTGLNFLIRFLNRIKATDRVRFIANYAAERNLQEIEVLLYSPRIYAAACIYIALFTVHVEIQPAVKIWTDELIEESGLTENNILPCAKVLMSHMREIPQASSKRKLDATKKKYSTTQTQFIGEFEFPSL